MKILMALILGLASLAGATSYPVKNFLQIPYSLESATNISAKTPDILSYYSNQRGKFPLKGEMNEITVPEVLSQMSYASYFCQRMIASDANLPVANRWVHHQIDFTKKPSEFSDQVWSSLFGEYAEIFWQRSVEADELDILKTEVRAMRANFPDAAASNQGLLTSICASFAGSFSFILL